MMHQLYAVGSGLCDSSPSPHHPHCRAASAKYCLLGSLPCCMGCPGGAWHSWSMWVVRMDTTPHPALLYQQWERWLQGPASHQLDSPEQKGLVASHPHEIGMMHDQKFPLCKSLTNKAPTACLYEQAKKHPVMIPLLGSHQILDTALPVLLHFFLKTICSNLGDFSIYDQLQWVPAESHQKAD